MAGGRKNKYQTHVVENSLFKRAIGYQTTSD